MAQAIRIEVSRRIAAPPERVFDAWLDPDGVGRWLFATPDGAMERIELDPRVGGRFLIAERRGGELAEHFANIWRSSGRIAWFSASPRSATAVTLASP